MGNGNGPAGVIIRTVCNTHRLEEVSPTPGLPPDGPPADGHASSGEALRWMFESNGVVTTRRSHVPGPRRTRGSPLASTWADNHLRDRQEVRHDEGGHQAEGIPDGPEAAPVHGGPQGRHRLPSPGPLGGGGPLRARETPLLRRGSGLLSRPVQSPRVQAIRAMPIQASRASH